MDHSSGLGMSSEARARVRKYKVITHGPLPTPAEADKAQRILLLSGPAGAGKTTTIRVLSKEMEIDLLEWGEGADDSSLGSGLGTYGDLNTDSIADAGARSRVSFCKNDIVLVATLLFATQHG
jgi:cell cycle checkpoint protein